METDPTRMCVLVVGLSNVMVRGVGEWPLWLRVEIETCSPRPACARCGTAAWDHGQREVLLVDLAVFGRPARLAWSKQRWRCPSSSCAVVTWSEHDPTIASERSALTTRAARWATRQVGKHGRAVSEVADDLACDWHTVNDAVMLFGQVLMLVLTAEVPRVVVDEIHREGRALGCTSGGDRRRNRSTESRHQV